MEKIKNGRKRLKGMLRRFYKLLTMMALRVKPENRADSQKKTLKSGSRLTAGEILAYS